MVVRTKKPLWGTWKVVVMYSGLCVLEVLVSLIEKGFLGLAVIKKRRYWPKGVPAEKFYSAHAKQIGWGCGYGSRFNKEGKDTILWL